MPRSWLRPSTRGETSEAWASHHPWLLDEPTHFIRRTQAVQTKSTLLVGMSP